MAEVVFENITKVFPPDVVAVDDLSLAIQDQEFIVLVGPSGCGKSTTLRMVAGLEEITSGTIGIGGRIVNEVPPKDRDIAMVFQNYALYPHMTVFKNMAFGLKMRKVRAGEIKEKVHQTARMLGIEHLLERKPKALSGGECQRVALGRAIVRTPRVFLFDEPLSNLDAKLRAHMRAEIRTLQRKLGTTGVYVTHDQEEAMTLGDRLVIMDRGAVQQCDTPLEVYHAPANRFVAGFFGSPPMSFLDGTVETGGNEACFAGTGLRVSLTDEQSRKVSHMSGQAVSLGIRAEGLLFSGELEQSALGSERALHHPASAIEMTVELVEPLGDRQNVHLATAAGDKLIARSEPLAHFVTGQKVNILIDPRQVHVFERGEKGVRLA